MTFLVFWCHAALVFLSYYGPRHFQASRNNIVYLYYLVYKVKDSDNFWH